MKQPRNRDRLAQVPTASTVGQVARGVSGVEGAGEKTISASFQFIQRVKPRMPNSISRFVATYGSPSTRNPQIRSVSWVIRDMIAPTCFLS